MNDLNRRQARVLGLLKSRPGRDIYEGGDDQGLGTGLYYVTYSAGETYEPLSRAEVRDLEQRGLIVERWSDCFKLKGAKRHNRNGGEID